MNKSKPPHPVHIPGTHKGEEMAQRQGREPGRQDSDSGSYRSARDSTSIDPEARRPIDPSSPHLPPA